MINELILTEAVAQRCSVKHLRQSLFCNKVAAVRLATLSKKRLWHKCFSVNFAKFLETPFLRNTSG